MDDSTSCDTIISCASDISDQLESGVDKVSKGKFKRKDPRAAIEEARAQCYQRLSELLEKSDKFAHMLCGKLQQEDQVLNTLKERAAKKRKQAKISNSQAERKQNAKFKRIAMQENENNKKIKLSHDISNLSINNEDIQECTTNNTELKSTNKENTDDYHIKKDDNDVKVESKIIMDVDEDLDYHQPLLVTGGSLRKYQIEGVNWLLKLYTNAVNCILADEMGLGKTLQCISLVAGLLSFGVKGPFLIVAPLSTIYNWRSEFKKFAPQIPALLYYGTKDERDEMLLKIKKPVHVPLLNNKFFPVVITSYEVAMKDRRLLSNTMWNLLIVDEGHRIKNSECKLLRELRKYNCTNKLLLTGTPLQNNLTELWTLLNFLLPQIFSASGSFEAWFDVEYLEKVENADEEIVMEEKKNNMISKIHQILRPFMLRRVKSDVDIHIPPKKEILVIAPMSQVQCEMYQAIMQNTLQYFNGDNGGDEGKKDNRDSGVDDNSDILDGKSDEGMDGGKDEDKDDVKSDEDKENNENIMNVSKIHEDGLDQPTGDNNGDVSIKIVEKKGKVQLKNTPTASERKLRNRGKKVNYSLAFNNNDEDGNTDYYDEDEDDDDESLSAWASSVVEARKSEKSNEIKRIKPQRLKMGSIFSLLMRCCKHPYLINDPRKRYNHDIHHSDNIKDDGIKNNNDKNDRKTPIKKENVDSENLGNDIKKTSERVTKRSVLKELNEDGERNDENNKECEKDENEHEKRSGEEKYDKEDLVTCCGKLQLLDRMLAKMKIRGHRVLIFSQSTQLLDLLEDYCELRGHSFCRIDGSMKMADRQYNIDRFKDDSSVFLFLLSTRAAGLGINLTSADTVVIYDSDWNPQCDLQAQDRCHRIGQTKPVMVYRMVAGGTIDQKIVERANSKRKIEKIIIRKGEFKSGSITNVDEDSNDASYVRSKSSKVMDLKELMGILKETDYAGVVQGSAMTEAQLEALLDRPQLIAPFHGAVHNAHGDSNVLIESNKNNDFKVSYSVNLDCNNDSVLRGFNKDCGSASEVANNCDQTASGTNSNGDVLDTCISQNSSSGVNDVNDDALNSVGVTDNTVDTCNNKEVDYSLSNNV